jgi:hypothetical protein
MAIRSLFTSVAPLALALLAAVSPAHARFRIIALPEVGDGLAIMRSVVGVGLSMAPGDETIVFDGLEGKQIADIKLGDDRLLDRVERKAQALAPSLHAVKLFTDAMTPMTDDAPARINGSAFLDAMGPVLAAHPGPADVAILGSVEFTAPHGLADKAYRGTFPSDGLLVHDRSASPFGALGRHDLPGANVYYCFPEPPSFFVSAEHLDRMKRAWALLIGLRGGRLVAFSGDQNSCLDRFKTQAIDPIVVDLDADDIKVLRMYRPVEVAPAIMDAGPIKPSVLVTRAPPPNGAVEAARFNQPSRPTPPRTMQGIAWLGIKWPDPVDLDIYARCRPNTPFLFYGHQSSPEGRHNYDYRSATGDAFETIDLTTPCPDISKAQVFVNYYAGKTSTPPTGVFAILFDGGVYKVPFALQATEGNEGRLSAQGEMSGPDWVKIDLGEALHLNEGSSPVVVTTPAVHARKTK